MANSNLFHNLEILNDSLGSSIPARWRVPNTFLPESRGASVAELMGIPGHFGRSVCRTPVPAPLRTVVREQRLDAFRKFLEQGQVNDHEFIELLNGTHPDRIGTRARYQALRNRRINCQADGKLAALIHNLIYLKLLPYYAVGRHHFIFDPMRALRLVAPYIELINTAVRNDIDAYRAHERTLKRTGAELEWADAIMLLAASLSGNSVGIPVELRFFWNGDVESTAEPVPFEYLLDDACSNCPPAENDKQPSNPSDSEMNDDAGLRNIAGQIVPAPCGWIFRPNPPMNRGVKGVVEYIFDTYADGGSQPRYDDIETYKGDGTALGRGTVRKYTKELIERGLIEYQKDFGFSPAPAIRARLEELGSRTKPEPN